MIHNGIEYAEMQLLAEAYLLLQAAGLGYPEMADAFARWNAGPGASYLLEITAGILRRSDPETGRPMPEIVLDKAGQKGTGQWAAVAALELGVAAPTLVEAVAARALSAVKEERVAAAAVLSPLPSSDGEGRGEGARDGRTGMVEALGDALYAAKIAVYAQGFAVLAAASREQGWGLDLARTAEIWRAGCIIRSALLDPIARAFRQAPAPANLMLAFAGDLATRQETWRGTVGDAASSGVPVPALASALAYHDGYRRARGGANLIQCQRDWFGAHGYERVDRAGSFHTEWEAS
jgi:6-phosphogluconate dehydrogenase